MSYSVMFALLLLTPLLFSLLCFACRKRGLSATCTVTVLHSLGITLLLILALWVVQTAADAGEIFAAGLWLHIDGLGGLFLAILGVIGFLTGVYSIGYMRHEVAHGELSPVTLCDYYGFFHLFLFTMLLVVTSNNLIVMWAAIEATTLSSAFLVGIYGQRSSLEAAWKYIIICTVGVAFGLFGTVLVYANVASVMPQAEMAIFWSEVLKQSSLLDPTLMLLAFVFVLIGFGTKTGLFPMHAWLPDAHSEAPSPVSALLSAVLLNCALLVLIRYYIIICQAIGSDFPNRLLLIFGMLSVAVAAFFILVQRDIKRLGGSRTIPVNVRVIAATNRDLWQMVEDRQFRSDLFYRLNVFPLELPPLRDRPEDIPLLAKHFTQKMARHMNRSIDAIPTEALRQLMSWDWPGNVRELENVIERAVLLTRGNSLNLHLNVRQSRLLPTLNEDSALRSSMAQLLHPTTPENDEEERQRIVQVLRETNGIVAGPRGAATRLGMKRTTLLSRMQRLGISVREVL
ncbi:TPA: sigma 54-interacting transcriptional regulator [Escherichia coli]|nr:hypothetical protein [Escherichia coli]HCA4496719.1 sigma 54-interacting transcriptional regulator [Escherichia coli]HDH7227752.1 sigma 54-interacting transcriptional regulator [Escherichia coli]